MDSGGNYLGHYNATGGNDTSLSMNVNGVTLQSYSPSSKIQLLTYSALGGNSATLTLEASTGNGFLYGGPPGNMYLGLAGPDGGSSSYTVLVNNQPRAPTPQEGTIQFGKDNLFYYYKAGGWKQILSTGSSGPPS